jgi:predicted outer membrane repeat protein
MRTSFICTINFKLNIINKKKSIMKKITLFISCILMVTNLFATDYYVKSTGDNANDGLTELTALSTVNQAITIASNGDNIIIVGSINQTGQVTLSKSLTFVGQNNATINGVDGDVAKMYALTATGLTISFTDITFQGSINKNSSNGAVFSITGASGISFTNCTFNGNSTSGAFSGGAISISNGTLTITNSLFKNNTAGKSGGAISVFATALISPQVTITGTTFYNNLAQGIGTSDGGGAIFAEGALTSGSTTTWNGQVTITKCTFFENKTTRNSTDYGIIRSTLSNVSVTNSLFYNNKINGGIDPPVFSDFGCSPGGVHSFTYSIGQWISNNIDTRTNFISFVKLSVNPAEVAANLTSSNLTYDDALGKVKYNVPTVAGENSPIGFVAAGVDAGAWQSGLTLSVKDNEFAADFSVSYNAQTKNLRVIRSNDDLVSLEIYNLIGSKVISRTSASKDENISASDLQSGVYVLVAKGSENKTFAKKFVIN